MGKIVSLNNERVRRVQALERSTRRRYQEGLFIAEGLRLVQEALAVHSPILEAFYTATFAESPPGSALVAACLDRVSSCWEVSAEVMQALADTETPQGILVVLPIPDLPCAATAPLTLIPDAIRDPGNLGTMLRTAWAAGVSQVLLPPGTVDYTNPKVVRAAMGAHFHLPIHRATWEDISADLEGTAVWLAEAGPGTPYDAVDWRGRVALIVGGEATGAGPEGRALAAGRHVTIPMAPGVDSLNAAMAAVIVLFEAARQRGVGR
ncbi:MAG: RNA methyltransferase [Anaerolineae bacterium]